MIFLEFQVSGKVKIFSFFGGRVGGARYRLSEFFTCDVIGLKSSGLFFDGLRTSGEQMQIFP